MLGFTRRSIPAISAHIVAPLSSSLQLHWLLRKDVAIAKNVNKLGVPVSQLQSEAQFEAPNALQGNMDRDIANLELVTVLGEEQAFEIIWPCWVGSRA